MWMPQGNIYIARADTVIRDGAFSTSQTLNMRVVLLKFFTSAVYHCTLLLKKPMAIIQQCAWKTNWTLPWWVLLLWKLRQEKE